ncbi:MAG: hypothetical protein ACIARQ_14350 [Phycisphaerales bacterium JB061]
MKVLLKAGIILAVLHLLLVLGFLAWFVGTGHLDDRRLGELAAMVRETAAERDSREAAEQALLDAELAAEEAEANPPIPLTSDDRITRKLVASEADQQIIQRRRRELQDLQRTLQIERSQLDDERSEFVAAKDDFDNARERIRQTEGEEQFQAALDTLATMKADQAHSLLSETLNQGANGYETVIAYLDNLDGRKRAAILGEFEKDDPVLAANLLELLRTRGVGATAAGP